MGRNSPRAWSVRVATTVTATVTFCWRILPFLETGLEWRYRADLADMVRSYVTYLRTSLRKFVVLQLFTLLTGPSFFLVGAGTNQVLSGKGGSGPSHVLRSASSYRYRLPELKDAEGHEKEGIRTPYLGIHCTALFSQASLSCPRSSMCANMQSRDSMCC